MFKDASANKGGVTSSSLEVLAALSLSEQEFAKNMVGWLATCVVDQMLAFMRQCHGAL